MTGSVLEQLAGFPLRRVVFAPVGTRLPRTASEPLDRAFQPFLVEDQPEPVTFWDARKLRMSELPRFQTMSLVLDVGLGDTVARLVLPNLRVEHHPDDGSVASFMFSPAMLRRFEQQWRSGVASGFVASAGGPVEPGSPVFVKGGQVYDPGVEIRNAAVSARRAGMGCGDIMQHVSDALVEEGQLERREQATARMRKVLAMQLGDLLRPERLDAIAGKLADEAERLVEERAAGGGVR